MSEENNNEEVNQFPKENTTPPNTNIKNKIILPAVILVICSISAGVFFISKNSNPNTQYNELPPNNTTTLKDLIQGGDLRRANSATNTTTIGDENHNPEPSALEQKIDILIKSIQKVDKTNNTQSLNSINSSIKQLKLQLENGNQSQYVSQIRAIVHDLQEELTTDNHNFLKQTIATFRSLQKQSQELNSQNIPFDLISVSIWDSVPQAVLRVGAKTTITEVGYVRLGYKIINIDFDSETITVVKNGQKFLLERTK